MYRGEPLWWRPEGFTRANGGRKLVDESGDIFARRGMCVPDGAGDYYGVRIHAVFAEFYDYSTAPVPDSHSHQRGYLVGSMFSPTHNNSPHPTDFFNACDSIDDAHASLGRLLLDQYGVERLFQHGSVFVITDFEFSNSWEDVKQRTALRLVINDLGKQRKRLNQVAVQVRVRSFNRPPLPTESKELQLQYREALIEEYAKIARLGPLAPSRKMTQHCREQADFLFSEDRILSADDIMIEVARRNLHA